MKFEVKKLIDNHYYIIGWWNDKSYICSDDHISININLNLIEYRQKLEEYGRIHHEAFVAHMLKTEQQAQNAID